MQVKDLGIRTSSRNLKQIPFSLKQLLMPILNYNFFNCRGCWENTHITAHIFTLSGHPVPPRRLNTCGLHLPGQEEWNQMGDFNEKFLMKHNGYVTWASSGVSWTLSIQVWPRPPNKDIILTSMSTQDSEIHCHLRF